MKSNYNIGKFQPFANFRVIMILKFFCKSLAHLVFSMLSSRVSWTRNYFYSSLASVAILLIHKMRAWIDRIFSTYPVTRLHATVKQWIIHASQTWFHRLISRILVVTFQYSHTTFYVSKSDSQTACYELVDQIWRASRKWKFAWWAGMFHNILAWLIVSQIMDRNMGLIRLKRLHTLYL